MTATPATAVHCAPLLTPEACDALLERLGAASWTPGATYEPAGVQASAGPRRRCDLCHELPAALVAEVTGEALRLGREAFGFTLEGLHPDDPPAVMRYPVGGGFDWHFDCGAAAAPFGSRKLSFTLQLDAPARYAGGDLELAGYHLGYAPHLLANQREAARAQGTLIAFAAFQVHRVAPVTRGVRHALVGWLHGPPFR